MKKIILLISLLFSILFALASFGEKNALDRIDVKSCYILDISNFLNVMTGDPFYTNCHKKAFRKWYPQLSQDSKEAMKVIPASIGKMIGPSVCSVLSATDNFDDMGQDHPFKDPDALSYNYFVKYLESSKGIPSEQAQKLTQAIGEVINDLESKGFRDYWTKERLPLIEKRIKEVENYLATIKTDPVKEINFMLGKELIRSGEKIRLYICSFAAPHGIRIYGKAYITDISFNNAFTLRAAVHEMFHPPFYVYEVGDEYYHLLNDPFYQKSFKEHNPINFGYPAPGGFLDENIVEAMEGYISSERLGILTTPILYLKHHDKGDHKLSFVLLKYFKEIPKNEDETFGAYMKRLIPQMPLGNLDRVYEEQMKKMNGYHSFTVYWAPLVGQYSQ